MLGLAFPVKGKYSLKKVITEHGCKEKLQLFFLLFFFRAINVCFEKNWEVVNHQHFHFKFSVVVLGITFEKPIRFPTKGRGLGPDTPIFLKNLCGQVPYLMSKREKKKQTGGIRFFSCTVKEAYNIAEYLQ